MPDDRSMSCRTGAIGLVLAALCLHPAAAAGDPDQIAVTLKDHRFQPAEIHVHTGKPTVLIVTNQDDTAEEFEFNGVAS